MPTYEYLCSNCEHFFEKFESIVAKPAKKCPSCGKMKLQRLIGTGSGIIFKGSGFYATDYRSDNYNQGKQAAKSAKTTKDDSKDTKKTTPKKAKPKK